MAMVGKLRGVWLKKKRKRSLRHQLRNPVAKDLRTPKYKLQTIPDKRGKSFKKVPRNLDYKEENNDY